MAGMGRLEAEMCVSVMLSPPQRGEQNKGALRNILLGHCQFLMDGEKYSPQTAGGSPCARVDHAGAVVCSG